MRKRESDGKNGAGPLEVSGPRKVVDLASRERELDEVVARLRNSDIDLRDYMPDLGTIMREASPERRAERLREALDLERDVTLRQSLSDIATLRSEADPARLEHKLQELIARAKSNDVELGEYFPDLEAIARDVDPARRARRLRSALDNPEIDEALAEARNSLARLDRATPNRGSVASPWAQQAPELGAIDKAALPSAMMPFSPAAETATDTEHAATLDKAPLPVAARPSRRWTIAQSVMAVVAVVAPLTMMYFLLVWQNDRGPKGTSPAATSEATATPPVSSGKAPSPSATPTSLPSVGPKVEEAPSASAAPAATTPPAPTAAVDASAAKPAPTPAPLQPPRGPALPKTGSSSKPLAPIPPPPPDQDPGINE